MTDLVCLMIPTTMTTTTTEQQQAPSSKPTMSKRDKLEALRAKRRPQGESAFQKNKSEEKEKGYDSGDSYNSADFMRTKEDDDFIDRRRR